MSTHTHVSKIVDIILHRTQAQISQLIFHDIGKAIKESIISRIVCGW